MTWRRFLMTLGLTLGLVLGTCGASAAHVNKGVHGRFHFDNPNKGARPCQMVQLARAKGWSPPFKPREARARFNDRGGVQHREVPWTSTGIITAEHVPFIIRCLAERAFPSVSGSYAIAVAECESHFDPRAVNGAYKGVFQMEMGRFEDFNPEPSSVFNGWANSWAAVNNAALDGWGAWSCP